MRCGGNRKVGTLSLLRARADLQRLPATFIDCASPLNFVTKEQRRNVVSYIFRVGSEFEMNCDTLVRAVQLFDRFTLRWNSETNQEWNRAEKALQQYKTVVKIMLDSRLNHDCADHILTYLQRPKITSQQQKRHFERMRNLAEETCMVCLCLASKFVETKFICYKDLRGVLGNRVTIHRLQTHEKRVLEMIEWGLNFLSAYQFEDLLYTEINFTPDENFKGIMKHTLAELAPMHELQHLNTCVIAAVAILSVLRRNGPEARYAQNLELLATACDLSGRQARELEQYVAMAVTRMLA